MSARKSACGDLPRRISKTPPAPNSKPPRVGSTPPTYPVIQDGYRQRAWENGPGMRALLVLNERSRRGLREGDFVCRSLAGCGIECVREASEAGQVDAVIAAGGDGTVISTVPEALERGVPLGIVPLGT